MIANEDKLITRSTRDCTGCRACELACSFYRRGVFAPSESVIRVKRDNGTGEIDIILYPDGYNGRCGCDCPPGEEYCLDFCPASARDELQSILSEREELR